LQSERKITNTYRIAEAYEKWKKDVEKWQKDGE
jgi:hypothetical protein